MLLLVISHKKTFYINSKARVHVTSSVCSWLLNLTVHSHCYSCSYVFNPLNAELNPICPLLALFGSHHILHVSRIRVKVILIQNRLILYLKVPKTLEINLIQSRIIFIKDWLILSTLTISHTYSHFVPPSLARLLRLNINASPVHSAVQYPILRCERMESLFQNHICQMHVSACLSVCPSFSYECQ